MLPTEDREFLANRFPEFTVTVEAQMMCVVMPTFPLPAGLTHPCSDLLLRLSPGYPDVAPDMWWFAPAVLRPDGRPIPQTQVTEVHLGRTWQRWSRHLDASHWRAGVDSLESYLALVDRELHAAVNGN